MRAFVVTAPHEGRVLDVASPVPAEGQVVVDVRRVGPDVRIAGRPRRAPSLGPTAEVV